jgi:hypothetical protein
MWHEVAWGRLILLELLSFENTRAHERINISSRITDWFSECSFNYRPGRK